MTELSENLLHPSVGSGGVIAVMGYLVVFFGIVLLLVVVTAMGRIMVSRQKKKETIAAAATTKNQVPVPAKVEVPKANGTAGAIKLYNVSERDAALVMAIVAYRLGKPVNELRFRSIKEVKE